MRPKEMDRRINLAIQRTLKTEDFSHLKSLVPVIEKFREICAKEENWKHF